MNKIYLEINVNSGYIPKFPDKCPICKARTEKKEANRILYKCGGEYTEKSQSQNNHDVYWGSCGKQ